jgi:predicted transcriptional regulator
MGVTSVRLLPEVEDGLEAMSGRLQRSKSWLINQALREYISRESLAEERWKETLGALESLKAGKVVEGEDVHAWLRSWGGPDELAAPHSRS